MAALFTSPNYSLTNFHLEMKQAWAVGRVENMKKLFFFSGHVDSALTHKNKEQEALK